MFTRKHNGLTRFQFDLDPEFASMNPARTYNVRRQDLWPDRTLFNRNEESVGDEDEYDKRLRAIFDSDVPESNDDFILGPTEVPPPAKPFEGKKLIAEKDVSVDSLFEVFKHFEIRDNGSLPRTKKDDPTRPADKVQDEDVIQVSDGEDDEIKILGEVKTSSITVKAPSTIVKQKPVEMSKEEKFDAYLRKRGDKPTSFIFAAEEKKRYDNVLREKFRANLREEYMRVAAQENRRKTTFHLLPGESYDIRDLIDGPVANEKEKLPSKERQRDNRNRSPSPFLIDSSSDEETPVTTKKAGSAVMKVIPAAGPKRVLGKEAQKAALLVSDVFVPKKESKLRSNNLDDYRKKVDANAMPKGRKEKEDEVMIIDTKKNKGEDKIEKFKIPRKEGALPPPTEKSPDQVNVEKESMMKKMRVIPPSEQIDILGSITEAMDAEGAHKLKPADNKSPMKTGEQWVIPRMPEVPLLPPSLPRRFGMWEDDTREEMMDISHSSPDKSPRPSGEKTISPVSSDEGTEVEKSPIVGESNEVAIQQKRAPLNMDDSGTGDLFAAESMLDVRGEENHDEISARLIDENELKNYRLMEVDDLKNVIKRVDRPLDSVETKEIPFDKKESVTDPRIPAPSPGTLSRWTNTKVELNLGGVDSPRGILNKDSEDGESSKKGVKKGENATKEFNAEEDVVDMTSIEPEKKSNEPQDVVVGEKEVGGRKYKIVKKVPVEPPKPPSTPSKPLPTKSCLKPNTPVHSMPQVVRSGFIRPPTTPPLPKGFIPNAYPVLPTAPTPTKRMVAPTATSIGRAPRLPDFVPPPGFEPEDAKKEREMREKKEKEEREKREREEKEKKERDEKMKREEEERRKADEKNRSSSSPEVMEMTSSSKRRFTPIFGEDINTNRGASPSGIFGNPPRPSIFGGSSSASLSNLDNGAATVTRTYEKGSEILGERPAMKVYNHDHEDVKYQLDMRSKVAEQLSSHKTMRDDPDKEYPAHRDSPSMDLQLEEQRKYQHELTGVEKGWKRDGIQPVWLQSLPYETKFSFKRDAGLYWPIIQASDRIDVTHSEFQSMDVLRSLGNNTHFATEKKTLLGLESRLPNGMTHKERFDLAMKGELEPRFKERSMYSRVFNLQDEEDARIIHNKKLEEKRRLLREHEEVMKKNAPEGVRIGSCDMTIDRLAFRDFPDMIQHYNNDEYERDRPYRHDDWYCTRSDLYMPYSDRANYVCHVLNQFNRDYNEQYEGVDDDDEALIVLDKAAFAAAQLELEDMQGYERVGVTPDEFTALMTRHKERTSLMESSSPLFPLSKYKELCGLHEMEKPHFHFIVDWLSSNFKIIKPISEWALEETVDTAFRAVIMRTDKKDRDGQPIDAREVFYDAFHASIPVRSSPPASKKSRSSASFERY